MSESLWKLDNEYKQLLILLEEEELDEDTIKDTLESMEGEFTDKADRIAYVMAELDGKIATRKKEMERLAELNEVDARTIDRLKRALFSSMQLRDMPKFETAYHKFSIVKNGGQTPLVYRDGQPKGEAVPEGFRRIKTDISVDTDAVRKALDEGTDLDWVQYGERGSSLRIK